MKTWCVKHHVFFFVIRKMSRISNRFPFCIQSSKNIYFWKRFIYIFAIITKGKDIKIKMDYRIRMRNLREDNDLTQQEIAVVLETSQTMYARYERGANELPIRHLIALARYYDVSTDYFLGLTSKKECFPKDKK